MRLTCPNCGAEYDVPEGLIPPAGKHVQCASCHTRWFRRGEAREELSEDQILRKLEQRGARPAPTPGPLAGPRLVHLGDGAPPFGTEATDPDDEDPEEAAPPAVPIKADPARPAEAEARAVVAAPAATLRPDARLDAPAARAEVRAEIEAAPREVVQPPKQAAPPRPVAPFEDDAEEGPRPALREAQRTAPRIELADPHAAPPPPRRRRGRFLPGFIVALLLAGLAFEIYVWRDPLAAQIPAAAPAIHGYANTIDAAREWMGERAAPASDGQAPG